MPTEFKLGVIAAALWGLFVVWGAYTTLFVTDYTPFLVATVLGWVAIVVIASGVKWVRQRS